MARAEGSGCISQTGQTALLQALEEATFFEPGTSVGVVRLGVESGGVARWREEVGGGGAGEAQRDSTDLEELTSLVPARKRLKREESSPDEAPRLATPTTTPTPTPTAMENVKAELPGTAANGHSVTQSPILCSRESQAKPNILPHAATSQVKQVAETPFLPKLQSCSPSPGGMCPPTAARMPVSISTAPEMPCESNVSLEGSISIGDQGIVAGAIEAEDAAASPVSGSHNPLAEVEMVLAEDTPLLDDAPLLVDSANKLHPLPAIAETQLPIGFPEASIQASVGDSSEWQGDGITQPGSVEASPPSSRGCNREVLIVAETQLIKPVTQSQTSPDIVTPPNVASEEGVAVASEEGVAGSTSPQQDPDSTLSLSPPGLRERPPLASSSPSSLAPPPATPSNHLQSLGEDTRRPVSRTDSTPELVPPTENQELSSTPASGRRLEKSLTAGQTSEAPHSAQSLPILPSAPPPLPPPPSPSSCVSISPSIPFQNARPSADKRTSIPDTFAAPSGIASSATPTLGPKGHTPIPSSQKTPLTVPLPPQDFALPGLWTITAQRTPFEQETPLPPQFADQEMDTQPPPSNSQLDTEQPSFPPSSAVARSLTGSVMAASRQHFSLPSSSGNGVTVIPDSVLPDVSPTESVAAPPSSSGAESSGCGSVGVASVDHSPTSAASVGGSVVSTQTGEYSQCDGKVITHMQHTCSCIRTFMYSMHTYVYTHTHTHTHTARSSLPSQYEPTTQQLEALREKMAEKQREIQALEHALGLAEAATGNATPPPSGAMEGCHDDGSPKANITRATPTPSGNVASSQNTTAPSVEVIAETVPDSFPGMVSVNSTTAPHHSQSHSPGLKATSVGNLTPVSVGNKTSLTGNTGPVNLSKQFENSDVVVDVAGEEAESAISACSEEEEEKSPLAESHVQSSSKPPEQSSGAPSDLHGRPPSTAGEPESNQKAQLRRSPLKQTPLIKSKKAPKVSRKLSHSSHALDKMLLPTASSTRPSAEELRRNQLLTRADMLIRALRSPPPVVSQRQTMVEVDEALLQATPPPPHGKSPISPQILTGGATPPLPPPHGKTPTRATGVGTRKMKLDVSPLVSAKVDPPSNHPPPRKTKPSVILGSQDVESFSPPTLPPAPLPDNHPFLSIATNQNKAGLGTDAIVTYPVISDSLPRTAVSAGPAPSTPTPSVLVGTSNQMARDGQVCETSLRVSVIKTPGVQLTGELSAKDTSPEGVLPSAPSFVGSGLPKAQLVRISSLSLVVCLLVSFVVCRNRHRPWPRGLVGVSPVVSMGALHM